MRNILIALLVLSLLTPTLSLLYYGGRSLQQAGSANQLDFAYHHLATLATNSFLLCLGVLVLALGTGIPLAFLLFRTDLPGRQVLIIFVLAAACLPLHVVGTAWLALLGRAGLLTPWLRILWPQFDLYGMGGAIWIMGWAYLPLVVLLTGTALRAVDPLLEQDGRLYLSAPGVVWHITLRCSWWGISGAALLVLVLAFGSISITDLLRVRTLSEEIYTIFALQYRPDQALGLSLILFVPVMGLAWLLIRLGKRAGQGTLAGFYRRPYIFPLPWRAWICLGVLLSLLPLVVPWISLIGIIGSWTRFARAWQVLQREVYFSVMINLIAALLTTNLALLIVRWWLANLRRGWLIIPLLLWLLVLPAPLLGIGLVQLCNHPLLGVIYDSPAILVLVTILRFTPLAVMAIGPWAYRFPAVLEEKARLDGCGLGSFYWRVFLPLNAPGLVLAWVLVFLFGMGELGASILVVPPGGTTLTIRIFSLLHYGLRSVAASGALIMILLSVTGAVILAGVMRYSGYGLAQP